MQFLLEGIPPDMETKPSVCEICELTLPSASEMEIHMQTHEDQKKFSCKVCDINSVKR